MRAAREIATRPRPPIEGVLGEYERCRAHVLARPARRVSVACATVSVRAPCMYVCAYLPQRLGGASCAHAVCVRTVHVVRARLCPPELRARAWCAPPPCVSCVTD